MLNQQWQLSYHGKMSYDVTEHMPFYEMQYFYRKLVEEKENEAAEMDKASKPGVQRITKHTSPESLSSAPPPRKRRG